MDDVIAEVINDQIDSAGSAALQHDDGTLSLDGQATLIEIEENHGIVRTNPAVTTIAGVVLAMTSTLPAPGTTVTVQGDDLTVEEVSGRKITRVHIRSTPPPADTDNTD